MIKIYICDVVEIELTLSNDSFSDFLCLMKSIDILYTSCELYVVISIKTAYRPEKNCVGLKSRIVRFFFIG